MILHFDKQEVPFGIEADFVGFVEFCAGGGATITVVAFSSGAGNDLRLSRDEVNSADSVGADFADVECLIGADDQSEGLRDSGFECGGSELQGSFEAIASDNINCAGSF